MSDLENELGIKIFERTTRGTVVTQDGRKLLAAISEILRSKSNLEQLAEFSEGSHRKEIVRIRYINTMFKYKKENRHEKTVYCYKSIEP